MRERRDRRSRRREGFFWLSLQRALRRRLPAFSCSGLLVLAMGAAEPPAAFGQTVPSLDARTWRPSTDPDAGLVLEPVVTPGPWRWNVGVWLHYAHDPFAVRGATGAVASR